MELLETQQYQGASGVIRGEERLAFTLWTWFVTMKESCYIRGIGALYSMHLKSQSDPFLTGKLRKQPQAKPEH